MWSLRGIIGMLWFGTYFSLSIVLEKMVSGVRILGVKLYILSRKYHSNIEQKCDGEVKWRNGGGIRISSFGGREKSLRNSVRPQLGKFDRQLHHGYVLIPNHIKTSCLITVFPHFHGHYPDFVLQPQSEVVSGSVDLSVSNCYLDHPSISMEWTSTNAFHLHSRGYSSPPDSKAGYVRLTGWVIAN